MTLRTHHGRTLGPLILIAVLFFSNSLQVTSSSPQAPRVFAISLDSTQRFQTIDGFGVNINGMVWDNGQVVPALDALSDTLGGTIFRVIVDEADWEATNDNADSAVFNWAVYNQIYSTPKFASLWKTLRYLEQKPNAQVILNVMGRVPQWMGGTVINNAQEDEWVEMVTSLVVYARQHEGLSIRLFSPFNEIDLGTSEGPGVNAQQSARLLGKVATRLSSLGMSDTKLTVPDVAIPSRMPEYLTAITADPTLMEHVADIAFHDYAGNIYDVQNFINNSAYPKIHYWLSEYSAWCEGCLTAPSQSESWALATNTADFLFNYLEQDANAALLWEGFDGYYYHHGDFQYWGIMSYDRTTGAFTPRHRYYTAQQIFRFVRPGMVRIGVQAPGSTLRILAFSDPASGALTIVGRNPTNAPVTLDLSLGGLASGKTLTLTQTTQNSHLATGTLTRTGDSISGQIAADSVFAISTSIPVPIPKTCAGSPRICLPLVVKPR